MKSFVCLIPTFVLLASAQVASLACSSPSLRRRADTIDIPLSSHSLLRRDDAIDFAYEGPNNPLFWHTLPGSETCRLGRSQSPINIDPTSATVACSPVLNIPTVNRARVENTGTSVEATLTGTTTYANKQWTLLQMHIHTPSEHRIAREYYPVELHLVHQSSDGALLVLAILFDFEGAGLTTDLLKNMVANIQAIPTAGAVTESGLLDFTQLSRFFAQAPLHEYSGSLTTPPCKEGVTFVVALQPLQINVETFLKIKRTIKYNARPVQNVPGSQNFVEQVSTCPA